MLIPTPVRIPHAPALPTPFIPPPALSRNYARIRQQSDGGIYTHRSRYRVGVRFSSVRFESYVRTHDAGIRMLDSFAISCALSGRIMGGGLRLRFWEQNGVWIWKVFRSPTSSN